MNRDQLLFLRRIHPAISGAADDIHRLLANAEINSDTPQISAEQKKQLSDGIEMIEKTISEVLS
ncbi:MAG: hypothetical protein GDA55_01835 [Cellvibrionales bacterium]|nr:hypothetical protein [Cellvibrionales bacterium]